MEQNGSFLNLGAINAHLRRSMFVKFCMIGVILLVCQIPMLMISALTRNRQGLSASVEAEVASKWGGTQLITGPLLAIPVHRQVVRYGKDGSSQVSQKNSMLFVVPENLKMTGKLEPEIRYRGIYEVVLYRSSLQIEGIFSKNIPIPEGWTPEYASSRIYIGISDMIGLSDLRIESDCSTNQALPGINTDNAPFKSGITIPLQIQADGNIPSNQIRFQASFSLNGCKQLQMTPLGKSSTLELSSPWSTPSFDGAFLPAERTIDASGFRAKWQISEFNRNISQEWIDDTQSKYSISTYSAGVSLIKSADVYAQVIRAATYSILIFLIVLMGFLIAERLTKVWMHPLQYILAALSLVLFYALALAFSEHIAFSAAYWLSVAIITGLCVFYSALIFRKRGAVVGMGSAIVSSYAMIFVLLRLEDYALLAGALVMVVLLGILMGMTGRLNQE